MSYLDKSVADDFLYSKIFFEYPSLDPSSQKFSSYGDLESSMQLSDYLVAFSTQSKKYCVGCVDMVNSTKIASRLSQKELSVYYEIFLNSMSRIISRYHGRVIKNVGDCLLYYFSDFHNVQDVKNCLDCGLVMVESQPIICKQLESKRLPRLNYRVSEDYGSVIIMNTSMSPSIDMIGPPVNVCTKINHTADKNEFVVGGDLREIAKKISGYKFEQISGCDIGFSQSYAVYKVGRK